MMEKLTLVAPLITNTQTLDVLFRNSICDQLFNITIARLNKASFGFLPCKIRENKI